MLKSFLSFIPKKKQATTANDQIQEQFTTPDDQQKESSEVRDDSLGVLGQPDDYDAVPRESVPKESNFTSQINSEKEKEQEKAEIATQSSENNPLILGSQVNESFRKIPISHKELNIPNDIVSEEVMSKIFADAQSLLDDENSIKDAASKSDDVKTVLNATDSDPLIVNPTSENKNLFECKCRTFSLLKGMCSHILAVACVLGRVLDFCIEVEKKWIQSSKRRKTIPNLTAGILTGLPLTQRGMKKNEVYKAARRKRSEKPKKDDLFTRSSEQSTTVQSQQSLSKPGTSQPCLSFSSYLNLDDYNPTTSGYLSSPRIAQASFQNSFYTSYPSSSFTQSSIFHPSHHIGSSQPALMSPFGEQSSSMGSSAAFSHHSYPYQPLGAPAYHSVISGTK